MSDTFITPTPGRIVWYRGADGEVRPAIVIKGYGLFSADLYVFPLNAGDGDCCFKPTVTHADPQQEPGCLQSWHWMPYQKQQAEKHASELARAEEPVKRGGDFGDALDALKHGKRVARAGWNGKGMWLAYTPGSEVLREHVKPGHALSKIAAEFPEAPTYAIGGHIDMRAADGTLVVGWLASQTDMLAEDWLIVE